MAFVSEKIRKEDEEYFNSIGFTQLARKSKKVEPFWWIIDREREIIMTCRGRVIGEPIEGYSIYIRKQFINIELIEKGSGNYSEKNITSHYIIQKIEVSKHLIEQGTTIEEVKQLIYDMFMAAGCFGFEREVTIETTVTIETEPVIV